MSQNSPVAIFLAATTIISAGTLEANLAKAGQKNNELGGLKEWTTDQKINDESKPDEAAKAAAKKAKEQDICIPIGEGENCW